MQNVDAPRFMPTVAVPQKTGQIPVLAVKVIRTYPHDPHAFTQGLECYGGYLYESTGIARPTTLRKGALDTRQDIQKNQLSSQYFCAGLTIFCRKKLQL